MDYWIVSDRQIVPDRRNGGLMTRVTFIHLTSGSSAVTYICPSNRNSANWNQVLECSAACIISDVDLVKKGVISADSTPCVVWSGAWSVLEQELEDYYSKNNYGDLFE